MCGRYRLTTKMKQLIMMLSAEWENPHDFNYPGSYNIAPSTKNPVLMMHDNKRIIKMMNWGLIPSWSLDGKDSFPNARSESLLSKKSFSSLVSKNRCIVLADGYYEWAKQDGAKIPFHIKHKDDSILLIAGLWRNTGETDTYTIITTQAVASMKHIHDRMPAILNEKNYTKWLNCEDNDKNEAANVLKPDDSLLEFYPVSTFVNSVRNNSPECVQRV